MNADNENSPNEHIPVLTEYLSEQIVLPRDGTMLDATVGQGGHSLLFGKQLGPDGTIIGLDVDESCITRAHINLSSLACKVILVRENFSRIKEATAENGVEKADLIIADLGFCSQQVADPRRGMSFRENMPLDMRLDDRLKKTAADIVNSYDEKALADLIYGFGQETASRRIARFIVQERKIGAIATTGQLSAIVCRALKKPATGRKNRTHPATKTFQALRIAVNNELVSLEKLVAVAPALLNKNGFVAVISFHSLEDRIVKLNFRQNKLDDIYEIMTKKPITATREQIAKNPRARSAKLRIARRK
ncbi:MAG: 16S rRNA (cytosine(1402)-N(4))-methyltransferase RsmH [Planctomycetota bacterium]